jgi:spore coat protein U-like protein
MNKNIVHTVLKLSVVGALATAGWLDAPTAEASGSTPANLLCSASVSANCTISTSPVAFGSYDPISANASAALTTTGGVSVTCTTGASPIITLGQGITPASGSVDGAPLRQMLDASSDVLAYNLYEGSDHLTVWGNTSGTGQAGTADGTLHSLTVYGSIPGGQNVPVGTYGDTVVATVSF